MSAAKHSPGPTRVTRCVHCGRCGKPFEILKSKGNCPGEILDSHCPHLCRYDSECNICHRYHDGPPAINLPRVVRP